VHGHTGGTSVGNIRSAVGAKGAVEVETRKQRLLKEAVKRVGIKEVAAHLRSPVAVVDLWVRGLARMPDRKLLHLADLLDKLSDDKVVSDK
jgi:hypothetical protein